MYRTMLFFKNRRQHGIESHTMVDTNASMEIWSMGDLQDPKMEVPTIYKAYVSEYQHKIWPYMVPYPKKGDLQDPKMEVR